MIICGVTTRGVHEREVSLVSRVQHRPKPVPLLLAHVVELQPSAPFHFDATVHKPDHFPTADNAWGPGVRW